MTDELNDPRIDPAFAPVTAPAALAAAIRARVGSIEAVKPLAASPIRAQIAGALALLLAAAGGLALGLWPRSGAPWWEFFFLVVFARRGIWLALRSSIPGEMPKPLSWIAFLLIPVAFAATSLIGVGGDGDLGPVQCLLGGLAVSLVPAIVTGVFVARAWPAAPALSGALCGLAGGMLGTAFLQIHCPLRTGPHLAVMHGGVLVVSLVVFSAVGAVALARLAPAMREDPPR